MPPGTCTAADSLCRSRRTRPPCACGHCGSITIDIATSNLRTGFIESWSSAVPDFMVGFRDPQLSFRLPSWNLWEDRRGIHTFTCSTVVAGLRAAANFARLFAESERARRYQTAADEIVGGMTRASLQQRAWTFYTLARGSRRRILIRGRDGRCIAVRNVFILDVTARTTKWSSPQCVRWKKVCQRRRHRPI